MSEDFRLWIVAAVLTTCIDMMMLKRRQTGRVGEQARARYLTMVDAMGGTQRFAAAAIILDFVIWPLRLLVFARRSVIDGRSHKADKSQCHWPRCKLPDGSCDEGRNCNN